LIDSARKELVLLAGREPSGLILGGAEDPKPVPSDALLALFKILKDEVRVIVFHGCYVRKQSLMNFVIWLTPISIVTSSSTQVQVLT